MNKAELESKHIAELHALAAKAGVESYRLLRREDLVEQLLRGESSVAEKPASPRAEGEKPAARRAGRDARPPDAAAEPPAEPARPRRRRRRFGRRKGLRVEDLLTPPPGRQALVYGESRAACTELLREVAAGLSGAGGPDPIALLVDPSPEELADWRREAPEAEIVAAGQARHASDALAQAVRRAEDGEDVTLLVDSLAKLEDADAAREILDASPAQEAKGSLTVVAAFERPA